MDTKKNFYNEDNEEFGSIPQEKLDETYLYLIKRDIDRAQLFFKKMPADARRGLTVETLRHFKCGWLDDWVNTKNRAEWQCGTRELVDGKPKPLPPPSRRIIVPTPDMQHFNAIVPPPDRRAGDDKWCKIHAGTKDKIFYDHKSLKGSEFIFVLEGEIDGMSVWQATQGKSAFVSVLGCTNWRNALMPQLKDRLKGKKFIVLFDKDSAQKPSENLCSTLVKMGIPAVGKFIYDYLSDEDKKSLGQKVDANDLLIKRGEVFLRDILRKIFIEARNDLKSVEETIQKQNLFNQVADSQIAAADNSETAEVKEPVEVKEEIRHIVPFIPVAKLDRDKWIQVGMIMKRYGLTFDEFNQWSQDDSRYNSADCKAQWNSFWEAGENNGQGYTIATLVSIAKEFGYVPHGKPKNGKQASVNTGNSDVDKKLGEWQTRNGLIDPKVLTELKEAKAYLDNLTPDKITPEIVQSSKTKHSLALCQFYDAYVDSVIAFYANVANAKHNADTEIKTLREVGGEFITPDAKTVAVSKITITNLKEDVKKLCTSYRKAHKKRLQAENARIAKEKHERAQELRVIEITHATERLEKLKAMPKSVERDAKIVATIRELCGWKYNKHGDPVSIDNTQENMDIILRNDPLIDGLWGFDNFYNTISFLKPSAWRTDAKIGDRWSDEDDAHLRVYLRRNYAEFGDKEKLIADNIIARARENTFHPIRDYFKSLPKWDGVKRAETLFIDWLKVDDTPFAREASLNWLTGAIARAFNPGCNYQNVIVFPGNQFIGKSYILERISKRWGGVLSDKLGDNHAIDAIRTKWIVEIKEGDAWTKSAAAAQKRFLDASKDTYRAAYAKNAQDFPRQCVFAITINGKQFLSDPTGNRRYLILQSNLPKFGYVREVRGEKLSDDYVIDQIWAEVYAHYQELFKDGFDDKKLLLSEQSQLQGEKITEQYVRDDGLQGEIEAGLEKKILPNVIWELLGREERRQYYANNCVFAIDESELVAKFKANHKKMTTKLKAEFEAAKAQSDFVIYKDLRNKLTGEITIHIEFYGTELRQHICATEIQAEFFDKYDKRVSAKRIHEVLDKIEGWSPGKRIGHDKVYGNQQNVFYRDADNISCDDEPEEVTSADAETVVEEVTNADAETIVEEVKNCDTMPANKNDIPTVIPNPPQQEFDLSQWNE